MLRRRQMGWRHRRLTVTEEPFLLAPEIKGQPLATIRRRGLALLIDMMLLAILGVPLLVFFVWVAMYAQAPRAAHLVIGSMIGAMPEDRVGATIELLALVQRRRPAAVPERLAAPLANGDLDELARRLEREPFAIQALLGNDATSYYDPTANVMFLADDALVGGWSRVLGTAAIAVAFFTFFTWIGGGRSPGKWLCGIRVVRLDGRRLGLWDAFGRAGGYAASASTLGLGFLEAAWDANRQALHDRVAGTVVIRQRRQRRRRDDGINAAGHSRGTS